ncbi:MAG: TIGR00730 family Rossman fold protein [Bacteroidaceae bacterium]|nr:TIGR00730 family Rossman fold protein [Prevotellaceae bacterium]MDY5631232.1 TIGR00730 family Rossman fold protein [Bacteroidaceae bacterium]
MSKVKNVAVYCASSTQLHPEYVSDARRVGQLLAEAGVALVNGAGNMGLMQATTDGCLDAGGRAIGVIPSFMIQEGWAYGRMTELVETKDMSDRKNKIAELSDAAIALPGGCGTMDELFELITNKQLGLYLKPIVILNTLGYYDGLLQWLERAEHDHFIRDIHRRLWCVAQTPEEAVQLALSTPLWDPNIRRFAKI